MELLTFPKLDDSVVQGHLFQVCHAMMVAQPWGRQPSPRNNAVTPPGTSPAKGPRCPPSTLNHKGMVAPPVWREDVERWGLVAALVHLHHRVGDGVAGHNLLVLHRGALESLPHVDILQGNWGHRAERGQLSLCLTLQPQNHHRHHTVHLPVPHLPPRWSPAASP